MTMGLLLKQLNENNITLSTKGDQLIVRGKNSSVTDPALLSLLRENKQALLALVKGGGYTGPEGSVAVPPNLIPASCTVITPEMLPLVALTPEEIDTVVAAVPGGALNVQDIYPLAPLQEGILFHHIMSAEGDPYLLPGQFAFDSRARLEAFLPALQAVIDRHDILRTAILWEGLPEPVQVVVRHATLSVEEVFLDSSAGDIGEQLRARFDPRNYRLDLRQAPLMRVFFAHDPANSRWVMLYLFHHLVMDHTALEVVQGEIMAHLQGHSALLPPPLPYRNYVTQARLGISREEHESFFRKMLGDVDEPTAPFGLLDVQGDGSGIVEAGRELEGELCRRLRENARSLGVSAASLFHLAWAQLLGRVSGRDDVVFGTVLFGRMQGGSGVGPVLGMFINTLPLRVRLGESVQESVQETHRLLAELLRHEHAPLSLAQRCSGVAAPTPLFSALLNYRHSAGAAQVSSEELQAWQGMHYLGGEERTNYPFTLCVDDRGDGFSLTAQVQSQLDPQRICTLVETTLGSLLHALEHAPSTEMRSLEVLSSAERHRLLVEWNATEVDYPQEVCIHQLFEQQARQTPAAVAVTSEEGGLSYGELNSRANRLAHHLRNWAVGPDARVGICVERSLEMVVGLLAILKAGGAYVPLDPAYPAERLTYMLQDSTPAVVLIHGGIAESVRSVITAGVGEETPLIDLDRDSWLWEADPENNPKRSGLTAEHLAYVIYTSGSTGKPKGVMVPHRGVVNRLLWMQDAYRLDSRDAVLQKTPFSFDVSVWEFFWPLLSGARLVMARPGGHKETDYLTSVIKQERITTLHFVPSMLQVFLAAEEAAECLSVVRVICSGEALPGPVARRCRETLPHAGLHNLYGPTEAAVDVTAWACGEETLPDNIPIGRPIANTRIYLLDPHGRPVPLGVAGELHIGGVQVARGYLNRPELTAERFVPDPFSSEAGARMYRTGDLARYLPNGDIEYLGRNDFQVKIRGFRIELGEIEARLGNCPGIRDAVVLAREDSPGDKRLVAYYTLAGTGADANGPGAEELRSHLLANLPEYMVPAAYVLLPALPLSPNGKLDRKGLPAPGGAAYASREYEAPRGELETRLARIWAEMLGVKRVGRHDNFFELGGHSLLAVTLIGRMRQAGLHADVRDLFVAPTLKALAVAAGGESGLVDVPPNLIPPACRAITPEMLPLVELTADEIDTIVANVPGGVLNIQDIYPLAPLQEGILFHHIMSTGGDPYLLQMPVNFDSRSRLEAFLSALQAVVDRHDILRTAVLWEGLAEPVQVVARQALLFVEEVFLDPSQGDIADQLHARFDPRHYRLDLRQPPLMRLFFAHDPARSRWVMLCLFHHLVIDHTTIEILQEEAQAHLLGQTDLLPPPLPYRNFVAQARLGVSREEHESFFRQMLADVDEATIPFGLTNVQGDGSGIAEARVDLGGDLARRLRDRARLLGVTVASICHLAWAQLLSRVSGRDDVVFGTVLFGRMQGGSGAERVPGLFINTLPLRIRLGEESVGETVRQTHTQLAELLCHEHAPLSLAQRCSGVAAPAPLFSALLNYRHSAAAAHPSTESLHAWEGVQSRGGEERSNYPFTLCVDDLGEGFALTAQVQRPLDPERVCAFMTTALESLLHALENAPETKMRSLEVLSPAERHQLLVEWNDTATEYPLKVCIHGLFEAQAELRPDAMALACEKRRLSYSELNLRANRLAHYLRSLGVGPDARVGICVERSLEMVVGLLAILKAGGAYVPLDPAYPGERIAYMLKDSRPVAVLTHGISGAVRECISAAVGGTAPLIDLKSDAGRWGGEPDSNPDFAGLAPDHLAYIIYTSGSTGTPKGVMIEHRNLANLIGWHCRAFNLSAVSRSSAVASIGFDAATWEIWPSLCSGGALLISPADASHDPEALLQWWTSQEMDVSFLPTPMAEFAFSGGLGNRGLSTLLVGGDRLRQLPPEPRSFQLVNNYGPTETTVVATSGLIDPSGEILPIGRPIDNTRVYLLDPPGRPVPIGVAGEIHIAGAGVARGYLNRPDLTAERFLPDPFAAEAGGRMYKSGDLGRWLPDGSIEFLGRNDFQVKIRGFRIELGEIEARLTEHPGVRDAVVLAREDIPGEQRLVVYYTAAVGEAGPIGANALRSHLSATLPDYMVPAIYVPLESLPLTTNGKLDRKALPAPESDVAYGVREYEAPQGEVETRLARAWTELLQVERVGRHDNFFELGGHSLLAVSLVSRLKRAGIDIAVADLFTSPTVALLAARQRPGGGVKGATPVRVSGNQRPLFLVHDYTGLDLYAPLLAAHVDTDIPVYGLQGVPLDEPQLQTMEGIAARLVRIIREVQPHGPYRLAGWSLGGIVAYEVAVQLIGEDQTVEFVGLLDTLTPAQFRADRQNRPAGLADGGEGGDLEELRGRCSNLGLGEISRDQTDAELRQFAARVRAHLHAYENYTLQRISIPVHLFVAEERQTGQGDQRDDLLLGWDGVLGEEQLHRIKVPGNHLTMMDAPHKAVLGKALSSAISQATDNRQSILPAELHYRPHLTIQAGMRGKTPVFCVPGAGDNVTSFIELAGALGADWPVHGLQPRGAGGVLVPHATVEAAARAYLKAINGIQPEGPVHLIGHSFGGWVALEIARQMRAANRPVASLTLIDSQVPGSRGGAEQTSVEILGRLLRMLEMRAGTLLGIDPAELASLEQGRQLELLHTSLVRVGLMPQRSQAEVLRGMIRTFAAALRTEYRPACPYPDQLRLMLVSAMGGDDHPGQPHDEIVAGWRELAPNLTCCHGPGNHMTVLQQPQVQLLAQWWLEGIPADGRSEG